MKRSEIRGRAPCETAPHYATLHAGYHIAAPQPSAATLGPSQVYGRVEWKTPDLGGKTRGPALSQPRGCCRRLCRGLPTHAVGQGHRLVGALQEFDGHEDHVLVADVFQVVDLAFVEPIGLVPGLAGGVGVFDRRAVVHVLAAAPAGDRGPEVVEHVAVEADALARLEADGPDPHAIGFRYQRVADAGVGVLVLALE